MCTDSLVDRAASLGLRFRSGRAVSESCLVREVPNDSFATGGQPSPVRTEDKDLSRVIAVRSWTSSRTQCEGAKVAPLASSPWSWAEDMCLQSRGCTGENLRQSSVQSIIVTILIRVIDMGSQSIASGFTPTTYFNIIITSSTRPFRFLSESREWTGTGTGTGRFQCRVERFRCHGGKRSCLGGGTVAVLSRRNLCENITIFASHRSSPLDTYLIRVIRSVPCPA